MEHLIFDFEEEMSDSVIQEENTGLRRKVEELATQVKELITKVDELAVKVVKQEEAKKPRRSRRLETENLEEEPRGQRQDQGPERQAPATGCGWDHDVIKAKMEAMNGTLKKMKQEAKEESSRQKKEVKELKAKLETVINNMKTGAPPPVATAEKIETNEGAASTFGNSAIEIARRTGGLFQGERKPADNKSLSKFGRQLRRRRSPPSPLSTPAERKVSGRSEQSVEVSPSIGNVKKKKKNVEASTSTPPSNEVNTHPPPPNSGDSFHYPPDAEWIVEKVCDQRLGEDGGLEYFLKWKGWGPEHNSWEPVWNLSCPDLIRQFETRKKGKNKRKTKRSQGRSRRAKGKTNQDQRSPFSLVAEAGGNREGTEAEDQAGREGAGRASSSEIESEGDPGEIQPGLGREPPRFGDWERQSEGHQQDENDDALDLLNPVRIKAAPSYTNGEANYLVELKNGPDVILTASLLKRKWPRLVTKYYQGN